MHSPCRCSDSSRDHIQGKQASTAKTVSVSFVASLASVVGRPWILCLIEYYCSLEFLIEAFFSWQILLFFGGGGGGGGGGVVVVCLFVFLHKNQKDGEFFF